ncbi:MAG: rRNA methyltransferase [Chloroflexi bacterium]|nr:rRNA methyltransferase [Chloroflexota bacterium]
MDLPEPLRAALEDALQGSGKAAARASADLSRRYRSSHGRSSRPLTLSDEDAAAYAVYRLPATYAAIAAVLREVRNRMPAWQPRTLLDVGAGPGTTVWAATQVWPGIEAATLVERDRRMMAVGKRLLQDGRRSHSLAVEWRRADLLGGWEAEPHDLVVAAYVLGELPGPARREVVDGLRARTGGVLAIVEPGTPLGFELVREARDRLRGGGGSIIAPCPHDGTCPMAGGDWCHFAQRLNRSRLHRSVKAGSLAYEDEKFSYVALSRTPGDAIAGRIVRHPQVRGGHVHLELCTPAGLEHRIVPRRDRDLFRQARDARWGGVFPAHSADEPR